MEGESPTEIADALGRSTRWVRKWVARHVEDGHDNSWAQGRSRAPHHSPTQTSERLADLIITARRSLVENPRAQYGALAVQWELRRLGVTDIPPARTIERVLQRAGMSRPRRARRNDYVPKGVPYPHPVDVVAGATHQIDMIGPRHLVGGVGFHVLNMVDVGSHEAGSGILDAARPALVAEGLAGIWARTGVPNVAQFDNHSNFRGGIPPAWAHFGPVVATCLDLGVTPRFIPLREPWRNGTIEHFNDTWDKSFFRTEIFTGIDHLRAENDTFIEFHNEHHRYSIHSGATPNQIWHDKARNPLPERYTAPTKLPAKGRIEVIRFIRSNRRVELFGKRVTVAEDQTHQYVTAIIKVRARELIVVTLDGEIIHHSDFNLNRQLR
jgi:transposase